mgnify:CR=1 FL=1
MAWTTSFLRFLWVQASRASPNWILGPLKVSPRGCWARGRPEAADEGLRRPKAVRFGRQRRPQAANARASLGQATRGTASGRQRASAAVLRSGEGMGGAHAQLLHAQLERGKGDAPLLSMLEYAIQGQAPAVPMGHGAMRHARHPPSAPENTSAVQVLNETSTYKCIMQ